MADEVVGQAEDSNNVGEETFSTVGCLEQGVNNGLVVGGWSWRYNKDIYIYLKINKNIERKIDGYEDGCKFITKENKQERIID